jgi:hypothetical protein
MTLSFPSSPTISQQYTYQGHTWSWNGVAWQSVGTIQGFQGPQGPQGLQGDQGFQGVQGVQGNQGIQGFGYSQSQGVQGFQGIQGIQGVQGVQGFQGTQGVQGVQGTQGPIPTSFINSVVTGLVETFTTPFGGGPALTNDIYLINGTVVYSPSNATKNFSLNFTGNATTTLNSLLSINQSITATVLNTNGTTAYYQTSITIDGTAVTPKWQGGTAPTSGNASSVDAYTYVIMKTAANTFAVFASQSKFA